MLSVLHILSSLKTGGAERVTIELAQLQRREAIDAQILSLGSEQDFLVGTVNDLNIPLTVSELGHSRISRYMRILNLIRKFDVVHCHSPRALMYIGPLIPLFAYKKIVYTRHGLEPLAAVKWKILHRLLRPFIDYVTFVTQSGCDVFKANHGWKLEKLRIINNGVFVPEEVSVPGGQPLRFGSVGRMVALKGQAILLDAIKLLARESADGGNPGFTLSFFGAGPLEAQLREQAAGLAPGMIEFCGEQPDLEKIYQSIDVLVVASRSEGLSMVIMEAMARARPAIATDVGGNGTLVQNRVTGLLVPYGNAELLANAMREMISNTDFMRSCGMAARNLIQNNFSLETAHRGYLQCYTD